MKKCPLRKEIITTEDCNTRFVLFKDCIKEECAWWNKDCGGCSQALMPLYIINSDGSPGNVTPKPNNIEPSPAESSTKLIREETALVGLPVCQFCGKSILPSTRSDLAYMGRQVCDKCRDEIIKCCQEKADAKK